MGKVLLAVDASSSGKGEMQGGRSYMVKEFTAEAVFNAIDNQSVSKKGWNKPD